MAQRVLTVAVPATVLAAVAWSSGGYFPRTWGVLLLLVAIGLAATGILSTHVELGWREIVVCGALLALAAWELVTTAWAVSPDAPVLEAERTLVYAGAAVLAVLAVGRSHGPELVLGVLVGAAAATVGGLVEHALGAGAPDDRLGLPVGYPNASGILATTALLLGLGLASSTSTLRRALGGAVAVPAAVALELSLSRGSILAAALGLLVLGLATPSLQSLRGPLVAATAAAGAVALAGAAGGLGDDGASAREALTLLALAGLSVAAAVAAAWLRPRSPASESRGGGLRRRALLVGAGVVAAVAVVAVAGYEVRESRSTPTTLEGTNRLLSASTSSRGDYWAVAAGMVEREPLLGEGAGGFSRVWLRERPALLFVLDAHNLYLETLAELGPFGLAMLLVALGTPLLAARRAVASTSGRAALAAYLALVAHAALDWDWELPAVALCTILLGVSLLRLGGAAPVRQLTVPGRAGLLAAATLLAACAVVVHAGNGATAEANDLLDHGEAAAARREAERARRYRPWAAEPWQLLGDADLAAGNAVAARRHLLRATREDPGSWSAWLSLALTSSGRERTLALARARLLNPLAPEIEALAPAEDP